MWVVNSCNRFVSFKICRRNSRMINWDATPVCVWTTPSQNWMYLGKFFTRFSTFKITISPLYVVSVYISSVFHRTKNSGCRRRYCYFKLRRSRANQNSKNIVFYSYFFLENSKYVLNFTKNFNGWIFNFLPFSKIFANFLAFIEGSRKF